MQRAGIGRSRVSEEVSGDGYGEMGEVGVGSVGRSAEGIGRE